MGIPLKDRKGFRSEPDHELVQALRELREDHGLAGCVLISFTTERVGVDSSGVNDGVGAIMHTLANRILLAIDDGNYDPAKIIGN